MPSKHHQHQAGKPHAQESSNSEQRETGGALTPGQVLSSTGSVRSAATAWWLNHRQGYDGRKAPATTLHLIFQQTGNLTCCGKIKKVLTNQLEKSFFSFLFGFFSQGAAFFLSNLAHAAAKRRIKWVHLFINEHLCKKPVCHLGNRQVVYLAAVVMTNTFRRHPWARQRKGLRLLRKPGCFSLKYHFSFVP